MSIQVIGGPFSPFVRKLLVVLEHKGIDYELDPVSPFPPPEHLLALNPKGQIPVLIHGDFSLPDSTAIVEYLEDKYPDNSLRPHSPEDRAKARWLEDYCDTTLSAAVGPGYFFQKIVGPLFLKRETDQEKVKHAEERLLPAAFDYLETVIGDGYLVGDRFSLADVALGSQLHNLTTAGYGFDTTRYPAVAAYAERIAGTPAFLRRRQHDDAILRRFQPPDQPN